MTPIPGQVHRILFILLFSLLFAIRFFFKVRYHAINLKPVTKTEGRTAGIVRILFGIPLFLATGLTCFAPDLIASIHIPIPLPVSIISGTGVIVEVHPFFEEIEMEKAKRSEFTQRVIDVISSIPFGRVTTYGAVAAAAGNPRGARVVVWVLNSSSEREDLPWHRVINSKGGISLKPGYGFELQKQLLESERIVVSDEGYINLDKYLWLSR